MEIMEVLRARHSVRQYLDKPVPEDIRKMLSDEANRLNKESGLHNNDLDGKICCNHFMRYG